MSPTKDLETPKVSDQTPPTPASPETPGTSWFSREEVQRYRHAGDENELARAIATEDPTASREEILFRYKLSQTVYLKDFDLPLLPGSAIQIMRLGKDPNAGASDYLEVIQTDPALASEVVRTSNSVLFARSLLLSSAESERLDLDEAIVRLGVSEIEKLAMLHSFNAKLFRVPGHGALVDAVIQHGVTVSLASQAVADEINTSPTEAFLAGLFHDAGKLILLGTIATVQRKLKWTAPNELVHSAFDAFHTAVGGLLCEGWELPEVIADAVRDHHAPARAAGSPVSQAVYLGNRIAHAIEPSGAANQPVASKPTSEPTHWSKDDPVAAAAGMSEERLEALAGDVSSKLATLG